MRLGLAFSRPRLFEAEHGGPFALSTGESPHIGRSGFRIKMGSNENSSNSVDTTGSGSVLGSGSFGRGWRRV